MSKATYNLVLLPGDGIGPEVTGAAVTVLDAVSKNHGIALNYKTFEAGAGLYGRTGISMADTGMEALPEADAILLGAMGLPTVRKPDGTEIAPQIDIRERFGLFASLRPCKLYPGVPTRVKADKVDMLVIREITEACSPAVMTSWSPATNPQATAWSSPAPRARSCSRWPSNRPACAAARTARRAM